MQTIKVKIKRMREGVQLPEYKSVLASGFDLAAAEDVLVRPGETVVVPTGIAVELPPGYELQVRPRSGVSKRTKLRISNTPGTIDADYRGEIGILVDNLMPATTWVTNGVLTIEEELEPFNDDPFSDDNEDAKFMYGTYLIRRGDRIAQAVIAPVVRAEFVEVDELSETERGAGGFGSTGVRG